MPAKTRPVGSFVDVAVFDFSQPSALCCGEGGMLVTDDDAPATELRYLAEQGITRIALPLADVAALLAAGQTAAA